MHTKRLIFVFILLSLLAAGCGAGTPKTVKVAISVPLGASFGQDNFHGAELALEKAGGKAGKYIVELAPFSETEANSETVSTPLVRKNAEEVVKDESIVGWVGPDSSRSAKEIIAILNRASVTMVSASNTWPGLTKPGYGAGEPGMYYPTGQRNYFRTVSSDEVQGAAAAAWVQKLGYKSVYILYGSDVYGSGIAGVFEITAKDIHLRIAGKEAFETETAIPAETSRRLAENAMAAKPDVVYLAGAVGSNAEHLAQALRQLDAQMPIMGPDGIAVDDLITSLGPDLAEGIYSTVVAIPPEQLNTSEARDFVSRYEQKYGKKPSTFDGAYYEAMSVMLYAIGRAEEPTREAVLQSMQNLGDYNGIYGTWHFDPQGDISISGISGMQVQNGAWVFVEALNE